jgi:hypothetical protein
MKVLFFIIAIAAFSTASAQRRDTFWVKPLMPQLKTISPAKPKVYSFQQAPRLLPNSRLLHTLPNGSEVYALPIDNMPCIVPDLSLYNYNMPVVKPPVARTMPNPSLQPFNNKPSGMSEEQFKKLLEMYEQHK